MKIDHLMDAVQRFDRFTDLAVDAMANASSCSGRDRKQYMRIAQIYSEMAISMPRPKRPTVVITANSNGATEGAAASH